MTLARAWKRPYTVRTAPSNPAVSRLRDRPSPVFARPETFISWWAWGVDQASVVGKMSRGDEPGGTLETRGKHRVGQAVDDVHQFVRVVLGAAFAPSIGHFDFPSHRVSHGYEIHTDTGELRGGHGELRATVPVPPKRAFDWEAGRYVGSRDELPAPRGGLPAVSAMKAVLDSLYISRRVGTENVQTHGYRILFALINGHTDAEIVRALIGGCKQDFFERATVNVLERVWDRVQQDLARMTK